MRFKRSSSGPDFTPGPDFALPLSLELCCGGGGPGCAGADPGPEATDAFEPEEGGVERSGPEAPGGSRNERRSSGSTSPNCGEAFVLI